MKASHRGFIKSFDAVSLQRKLLLFIVVALSLLLASSGVFVYKLINKTFMQSERAHIATTAEVLSKKIGVWYFLNSEAESFEMDRFLKSVLVEYKLEYIAFRNIDGILVSEITASEYVPEDPYNVEHKKNIYSPEGGTSLESIGTLEIAYGHHMLKEFRDKYYTAGILLVILLALYFYLEMRLLKGLLMPLRKVAAQIKGYMPGDRLVFDASYKHRDDVIFEIIHGFRQMQQNIDDALKEREMEEERNRAKDALLLKQSRFVEMGTMINNIAHQWKQPLNIVELCIADLTIKGMMGKVDNQYQNKLFNDMHTQVAFMSKTIDVFKNFLNEDQSQKTMELFTLSKAVEDVLQLLGSTFANKKIEIETSLNDSTCVYGSISEIEQAILSILNNAIDAIMDRNGLKGKIIIECKVEETNNIITIRDNGGGFDPELSDTMFDAYFTTKHQAQGTGLGLFIAKTVIEMKFNGTIEAYNADGGALFVIKLPLPNVSENHGHL